MKPETREELRLFVRDVRADLDRLDDDRLSEDPNEELTVEVHVANIRTRAVECQSRCWTLTTGGPEPTLDELRKRFEFRVLAKCIDDLETENAFLRDSIAGRPKGVGEDTE